MGMGKLYEEFLGQPSFGGEAQAMPIGYDLEVSKKRKIALLKELLGEDYAKALQGVRISENKGEE